MPIRVGIDLTSVTGVQDSISTHAERYLDRVYTDGELADCQTPAGLDAERLAARFAVKEAAMKVLRPERDDAVPWTEIEVRHADASGRGRDRAQRPRRRARDAAGVGELSASLTHEAEFAAAVVVAEMTAPAERADG